MTNPTPNTIEEILFDFIGSTGNALFFPEHQRKLEKTKAALESLVIDRIIEELSWYESLICEFDEGSDWAEHTIDRLSKLQAQKAKLGEGKDEHL